MRTKQSLFELPPRVWVFLVVFGVVCTATINAVATQYRTSVDESSRATRACVYATGAATPIDCSNAVSASSAVLTRGTRYNIMCTDDSYLRWGATAPTAAAGDMILYEGQWLEFLTATDAATYVACKNVTLDKACYYVECR